jgi:cytoskeletal protein CcmA (bactofilin family)
MKSPQDVLTIDPVAMNVVNRVCAGSRLAGQYHFKGGLLVQGEMSGDLEIRGRLIVWTGAQVSGRIKIWGDLYLFGQLGTPDQNDTGTVVECMGTAYIASTGVSSGNLLAYRIRMYDGAQLQGPFKTLKGRDALPELNELAISTQN